MSNLTGGWCLASSAVFFCYDRAAIQSLRLRDRLALVMSSHTMKSIWLDLVVSASTLSRLRSLDPESRFTPGSPRLRRIGNCRPVLGVIWALMFAIGWGQPITAHAEYKVLFIGNSFTIGSGGGGVPGIFDRLAQAGGQENPTTVMQAVGGMDYQFHSQDPAALAAIQSQPWTHVVLQNYSTEPTHLVDGSHSIADHLNYGTVLYQQIMANNPQTKVILFETWSRAAAHSLITGVSTPNSFASTDEFQAELRTNYHRLASLLNSNYPANPPVTVAPVGDAWQNAGGLLPASAPGFMDLHTTDDYHGNNNGYYLAAAVFYSHIYGVSPQGLGANPLVSGLNLGLTVPSSVLEEVAWTTVSSASLPQSETLLIDFGAATTITTNGPSPNDPLNFWNNVTPEIGTLPGATLSGLVTARNQPTSVGLVIVNRFNGANEAGTTVSTTLPLNATRDSLFGNTEVFGAGLSNIFPSFKLTGLDDTKTYTLTFHASRAGVTDNRETLYTVTGAATATAVLNAANNIDTTVAVSRIAPGLGGVITIALTPGPNNNNANHFTYIGSLKAEAVPVQTPIVFTREPVSQDVMELQPAVFSAAVQGSPPYFIQWSSNAVPIAGANQFTYSIPSASTNLNGIVYSVTVSNLTFSATSSNATLRVIPNTNSAVEAQSLLFDFGGGSTTERGPAPDDPNNNWNNVSATLGATVNGQLVNCVTVANVPSGVGLVILSRFNGANENGTTSSTVFPADATRDSLFGNTEAFNGLTGIFPSFKLTGLNPAMKYNFTFYASRTGVSDNRETGYTVTGATPGFGALNAANNVNNVVLVSGIAPTAGGEITVSLAPTANNNNVNHFTYLGGMKVTPVPSPLFQAPAVANGQVTLEWTGTGILEWAPSPSGPWSAVNPTATSPYAEAVEPSVGGRFYRIRATP